MALRRDALAAAAEFVLAAERLAQGRGPLVATVGRIAAQPGAANVIPGRAELTLDVRHPSDRRRRAAFARILAAGRAIARRRGVRLAAEISQDNAAAACSAPFTALLTRSVRAVQGRSRTLPSGAGHDGVILAAAAPVAMLFVRCRGGLSHHPDEYVHPRDLGAALQILVDFLGRLAARSSS
jgi:allantoate deiminase